MSDHPDGPDGLSDAAFCHRVTCYLDGELSPDDLRVLDVELQAEASKRGAFVRLCLVRMALIRQGAAVRAEEPVPDTRPLDDAMILPALRAAEVDDPVPAARPAPGPAASADGPPASRPRPLGRWWGYGLGVAAVLAVGIGINWVVRQNRPAGLTAAAVRLPTVRAPDDVPPPPPPPPRPAPPLPPPPPAVVTATAGVAVGGPDPLVPRMPLAAGRSIRLTIGAAELTFASGATVLVRAPADVRVVDADGLVVNAGAVYAHVPPAARGFRVTAPGLGVVDRGTNFGLRTGADGVAAEVHVFDGLVEATGLDPGGRPTADPVRVTTGQAVTHAAAATAARPVSVPFAPVGFDRDIADIRLVIPARGTGSGLAAGDADPNWELVSMPGVAGGPPRPALVLVNPSAEYAGSGTDARWIAPTSRLSNAPQGRYVYRTTLDLTGYDAASARVRAVMTADDGIVDVRVNGTAVVLPPATLKQATWKSVADTALAGPPWRSGLNQVDVVVYNGVAVGRMNPTGLLFGWTVTAAPLVRR